MGRAGRAGPYAIAQDPDRVWRVKNARTLHGSVTEPEWFGFPDIAGDGLPVWHESHLPTRGTPAQPLLENLYRMGFSSVLSYMQRTLTTSPARRVVPRTRRASPPAALDAADLLRP